MDIKQKMTGVVDKEANPEDIGCPSKFLITCLNSVETEMRLKRVFDDEESRPLFADKWGFEFWKCYVEGKSVLETRVSSFSVQQIAWIISTAADEMSIKEEEGLSPSTPYLLFLVPSQEKAMKVRSVCKSLQEVGIQTVSLHAGASVEHQIQGLEKCEPEFIVSTPERLLELISVKAVDVSGVCLLVVDELEMLMECGSFDTTKSIVQLLSDNLYTVVFSGSLDDESHLVKKLLPGKSSHRL